MPLTFRYSIQASPLAPAGFVGNYGRMMVDYRPIVTDIVLTASDYTAIAVSLSEGRAIRLIDDTGRTLGDFLPALSGGFDTATFTEATLSDLRVGFKPTQELLAVTRSTTSFEIVPTVSNNPAIDDSQFSYEILGVKTVLPNGLLNGISGLLRVNGTHFVKGNVTVTLRQYVGGVTPVLRTLAFTSITSTGAKYIETMITPGGISGAGFLDDDAPDVEWTQLRVSLTDTPARYSDLDIILQTP